MAKPGLRYLMPPLLEHTLGQLMEAHVILRTLANDALPAGLDFDHYMVLHHLHKARWTEQRALAEHLCCDKQTLSRRAAALEGRGWIVRQRSSLDGRRQRVRLTEAGASMKNQLTSTQAKLLAEALTRATPEAAMGLDEVLSELTRTARGALQTSLRTSQGARDV